MLVPESLMTDNAFEGCSLVNTINSRYHFWGNTAFLRHFERTTQALGACNNGRRPQRSSVEMQYETDAEPATAEIQSKIKAWQLRLNDKLI